MAEVETDNDAALAFLRRWAPSGPWVLTSIRTDRKAINTRTLWPSDEAAVVSWLEEFNGKRNIYFHVNPPIKDISKKAEREDIKSLDWLHVDIDPRAGEDIEEERKRALGLLTTRLPEGVPAPTCIVFSGGGYQGFWRLAEPIPINGDLEIAEDLKRYNMQLEVLFGADNCHNIDRIMRLPGTINLPDARKLKKGRVPTLATLQEFTDAVHPIETFTKAPQVQLEGDRGFHPGAPEVSISGNVERVQDASELDPWDISDRVKIIMAQGRDPDNPKEGDDSRSAWLFDFLCQLLRGTPDKGPVPDDLIFSIITDPEWPISESVLEHKGNSERYALRQMARAKEWIIDPRLEEFNGRFAVIRNYGGKCLVVEDIHDYALGRPRLTKMSLEQFAKGFENQYVQVGEDANGNAKFKTAGNWWRGHARRRQYETIVFAPERQVPNNVYNLWKGFGVQAAPGRCALFLDHVCDNVCAGDETYFKYLMGWMARAVQSPGTTGEVAIVLRGGRGVGKSFFAKVFGRLFGRHFMQVSNSSHLIGNFNSHLRDLVVLFADEAFYAGDKRHESILKTLVTEEMMAIEAKGVDIETSPNYIHLIMAANDVHVIPAGGNERRFFVLDVSKEHQQDTSYFGKIVEQLDDGGYEALLHALLTHDIEDFEVRRVPQTEALHEQKLLSLNVDEEWWYQKLVEGVVLPEHDGWVNEVMSDHLTDDYIEYTRRFNMSKRGNQTALGKFLQRMCPSLTYVRRSAKVEVPAGDGFTRTIHKRCKFWGLPTLADVRAHWEELHGPERWDEGEQEILPQKKSSDPPF